MRALNGSSEVEEEVKGMEEKERIRMSKAGGVRASLLAGQLIGCSLAENASRDGFAGGGQRWPKCG